MGLSPLSVWVSRYSLSAVSKLARSPGEVAVCVDAPARTRAVSAFLASLLGSTEPEELGALLSHDLRERVEAAERGRGASQERRPGENLVGYLPSAPPVDSRRTRVILRGATSVSGRDELQLYLAI